MVSGPLLLSLISLAHPYLESSPSELKPLFLVALSLSFLTWTRRTSLPPEANSGSPQGLLSLGAPQDDPQDMYFNHLNISLGINYKDNGLLYHNIDRVWVVTKVILPKLEDISFPDVKFNAHCLFVNKIRNAHPSVKTIIQSMCKSMKPLITLIKQKEKFYEMAIQSILKEEIPWSLCGKVNSQLGSSNQDPVSAGWRFSHSTKGEMPVPVHRKKAIAAFLPAIAGLAKIAVERLSTFLQ